MCGISGVFSRQGNVDQALMQQMALTTQHRGPDHEGLYISPDGCVGLAHNRLSIIDLSEAANQPMTSANGQCRIVFNGEIYNHLLLRKKMGSRIGRYTSHSDTETLLESYVEKGTACLEDLIGMFAFCIYDETERSLFLARDRVGVKPLYYVAREGVFAFASEIKPLLRLPFVSRALDPVALDAYFTLGYIPGSLCIFRDIRKLRPAHYATFVMTSSRLTIRQYWELDGRWQKLDGFSEPELVDILEHKLRDSVRLRMLSDVPIGCFLSGGLDSSIVSSLMALESDTPIRTFNISFSSKQHDESAYARMVADHIGATHTECRVEMDASKSLYHLIDHFDEPLADSSMIPTYYVSKVARKQVVVVLSGDGGDELFGGYNWYSWLYALQDLQRKLGFGCSLVRTIGRSLPRTVPSQHLLSCLGLESEIQFLDRVGCLNQDAKNSIYSPEFFDDLHGRSYSAVFLKYFRRFEGDLLQRMTGTDLQFYLPDDILAKVDRCSMAVSLEARVPWLDHRIVEFAFSLPSKFRWNQGTKKYLTKKLSKKLLPKQLPVERKQGFSIPLDAWMDGELGDMLQEQMGQRDIKHYLKIPAVKIALERHRRCHRNKLAFPLFSLLVFSLWFERFVAS